MKEKLPTASDMDELLAFLPRLYAPGFKPVDQWKGGEKLPDGSTHVPWPEYNSAVREFFEKAAQPAWADYNYLAKVEGSMAGAQDTIKTASLSELRAMLTYCVRGERFSGGHWAALVESEVIRSILERLQELRSEVS